jgi:thiol-disulfide isomerase/thioredoxin
MKKVITVIFLALSLSAAAGALKLGDPAPAVKADLWLNGEPVNPAERDGETLYVVEFWATWCPPCLKSIPHLNELQAKWKDQKVVFIGITDEPEEIVRPFFEKMKMAYHVAIDTNRATVDAYMKDIPGIPHAFVVDSKGLVVWSGHPLSGLEEAIGQLLEGTYDMKITQALQKTEEELQNLVMNGEYEKAAAKVEELIGQGSVKMEHFQVQLGLLAQTGETDRFPEVYRRMFAAFEGDAESLNTLAWIACTSPFSMCDLDMAWKAAQRAAELTERKDPAVLDTLARVHYALGMLEEAAAIQEEAVKAGEGDKKDPDLEATRDYYRSALEIQTQIRVSP